MSIHTKDSPCLASGGQNGPSLPARAVRICMVAAHRRLNRTRYRLKAGIDPESPYQAGREGWARVTPRRAA